MLWPRTFPAAPRARTALPPPLQAGGRSGKAGNPFQTTQGNRLSCRDQEGSSWRRAWQPTPVFVPGESHGQRSLAGYGLWGCKSWTRLSTTGISAFPLGWPWEAQSSPRVARESWGWRSSTFTFHFHALEKEMATHSSVLAWCPTFSDPTDHSLPGSSVHRILQAGILEWVTIPFSRGSSQGRG